MAASQARRRGVNLAVGDERFDSDTERKDRLG